MQFIRDGHTFLMAQSFAKNFGLYGQRVGTLSAVCADKEEAQRVMSQIKILIRPNYSNPPIHGARIVSTVLKGEWRKRGTGGPEAMDRNVEKKALVVTRMCVIGSSHSCMCAQTRS